MTESFQLLLIDRNVKNHPPLDSSDQASQYVRDDIQAMRAHRDIIVTLHSDYVLELYPAVGGTMLRVRNTGWLRAQSHTIRIDTAASYTAIPHFIWSQWLEKPHRRDASRAPLLLPHPAALYTSCAGPVTLPGGYLYMRVQKHGETIWPTDRKVRPVRVCLLPDPDESRLATPRSNDPQVQRQKLLLSLAPFRGMRLCLHIGEQLHAHAVNVDSVDCMQHLPQSRV